jgi:thioredoxin 1
MKIYAGQIQNPMATCSCKGGDGSEMLPLLVIVLLFIGFNLALSWFKKSRMKGKPIMKHIKSIAIVAVLVVAVGAVVAIKQSKKVTDAATPPLKIAGVSETALQPATPAELPAPPSGAVQALPKLVDLGAGKCIPCKMMAPILEDFKKSHSDKFEVQFIDVWQNPEPGKQYGIRVIPTQIFFAPDGKELFRHEGFFGKEDILAKWKELGF